ncbi:hypothetical protein QT970_02500, partial [Microcoleus sp. herbarium8]
MSSLLYIEPKEDSAEKLAAVAGKPTKNVLFASEVNAMVAAINAKQDELKILLERNGNVGVYNEDPEYILDCKVPPPIEKTLTGTFSFNGSVFTGVGTLMLSEIGNKGVIKVLSTGVTYQIDYVFSNTEAYSFFGGGTLFSNEV